MTTEENNQMFKSGINWILLDDTFIGQTLTSDKFTGKFAPGSMLLVPNSTDDYCDYKLYFVDLNKKIHNIIGNSSTNDKDSKSLYELAKEYGFEGTEEEWLESLTKTFDLSELENYALKEYVDEQITTITDNILDNANTLEEITANMDNKADKSYVDEQIAAIVGTAPDNANTLGEIMSYIDTKISTLQGFIADLLYNQKN